jgi:quinol monooxygenase YgiN
VLAMLATRRWKLQTGPLADLTPSMHWPEPVLAGAVADDAGPVMVTVEYLIEPQQRAAFLAVMARQSRERRRDGAYAWEVFEDTAQPGRMLETFLLDSWLEHLRQHRRVTHADRAVQEQLLKLVREEPRVTHYIAAEAAASGS